MAAVSPPHPVFNLLPETPCGIHRAPQLLELDIAYLLAADGTVRAWTEDEASNSNIIGVSCFAPGVPHTDLWTSPPCSVLSRLGADYRIVHDYDIPLRQRRDGRLTRVEVKHFSLFTVKEGKSVESFRAEVLAMFVPCAIRAQGEDGTLVPADPWELSDLEGVTDRSVCSIYRVAKHAYSRTDNPTLKLSLNSLMTAIAENKPASQDFYKCELGLLRDWYHTLLACDSVVAPDALALLGPAQAFLEDVLDMEGDDDVVHGAETR